MFALLALLSAYSPQPGDDPGPSNLLDTVHAYEVIAAISERVEASAVTDVGGQFLSYADGPRGEIMADACARAAGHGSPYALVVELWVSDAPLVDRTVIYYGDHPLAQQAADTIAAGITDIGWPVVTQHDPTLPSTCRAVRVGMGSVRGTNGQIWMGWEAWRTSFASQLALALISAVRIPDEE